jgi:hypothetical protein
VWKKEAAAVGEEVTGRRGGVAACGERLQQLLGRACASLKFDSLGPLPLWNAGFLFSYFLFFLMKKNERVPLTFLYTCKNPTCSNGYINSIYLKFIFFSLNKNTFFAINNL